MRYTILKMSPEVKVRIFFYSGEKCHELTVSWAPLAKTMRQSVIKQM